MLVACPPTVEAFLAGCSKPEAFTGNPSGVPVVPGIPTPTIERVLRRQADRAAVIALSDRATLPILEWDEAMEDAVCAWAARELMAYRGFDRQAGADTEIVRWAEAADKFLEGCAPGAEGKRYTPRFVDSASNKVIDGVLIRSSGSADAWSRRRATIGRGRCCG